jgi:hypothetical protein
MRRGLVPWLMLLLLLVLAVTSGVIGFRQAPASNDAVVFNAVQSTLNAPDFVAVTNTAFYPADSSHYSPVTIKFQAPHTFVVTSDGESLRPQGYTLSEFDSELRQHPKGWTKHVASYEWSGTVDYNALRISFEIQRGYLVSASYHLRYFASTDVGVTDVYFERIGKWNVPQSVSPTPVD